MRRNEFNRLPLLLLRFRSYHQLCLHLRTLRLDLLRVLDDHVPSGYIGIGLYHLRDRVELLAIVLLVQVHAIGKHLLDIADFDGHVG